MKKKKINKNSLEYNMRITAKKNAEKIRQIEDGEIMKELIRLSNSTKNKKTVEELIERRLAHVISKNMHMAYSLIEFKHECYWCKKDLYSADVYYALVNVWGTVYDVPCCKECFPLHHGKNKENL